jgi:chromosome segregation ATPase
MRTVRITFSRELQQNYRRRERFNALLASLATRRSERFAAVNEHIAGLQARADEADELLRRFYEMVEVGLAEMDDLLKDRIKALQAERETAHAALDRVAVDSQWCQLNADRDPRREDCHPLPIEAAAAKKVVKSHSERPNWAPSLTASRSMISKSGPWGGKT